MGDRMVMSQNRYCRQDLGHTATKLQIDPTGNHRVMLLGHNPSMRLMPLRHKINVYSIFYHHVSTMIVDTVVSVDKVVLPNTL